MGVGSYSFPAFSIGHFRTFQKSFFPHVLCATLHALVMGISKSSVVEMYSKGDLVCSGNLILLPDLSAASRSKGYVLS